MIRYASLVLLCLTLTSPVAAELPDDPTLEELKQIASMSHSPKLSAPQLRVYPSARKYQIRATMHIPQRDPASIEMDADEKWVDGRYIVSSFRFPDADEITQMIVTYDAGSHCYRKWVIGPDRIGETMIGTRVGDSRTISWASRPPENDEDKPLVVSQEAHTDKSTEWSELHIKEGRIIARVVGKAVASQ